MTDDLHQVRLVHVAEFCDVGVHPSGDDGVCCAAGVFGVGRLSWLKQGEDEIHMDDGRPRRYSERSVVESLLRNQGEIDIARDDVSLLLAPLHC